MAIKNFVSCLFPSDMFTMTVMKKIWDETENFLLTSEFETVEIRNKHTGEVCIVGDHYGDPSCGAISADELWCVSGGEGIVFTDFFGRKIYAFRVIRPNTSLEKFKIQSKSDRDWLNSKNSEHPAETFFVHELKIENSNHIRILLDPWAEYASVWRLEISSKRLVKLEEGPDLRNDPWREVVVF